MVFQDNAETTMNAQDQGMTLTRLRMLLQRWLPLILLTSLVAGGTAFVLLQGRSQQYTAKATLLVGVADQQPNRQEAVNAGQGLARTYARIFNDARMFQQAIDDLKLQGVSSSELQKSVEVFAVRDTQLVDVQVTWNSADEAINIANYMGKLFAQSRQEQALSSIEPTRQFLAEQRTALEQQLNSVARSEYGNPQTELLQYELEQLSVREQSLQFQAFDIRRQIDVVAPASTATPVGLSTGRLMLIAVLASAALALGVAVAVELFVPTMLPQDVAKRLGLPNPVVLPRLKSRDAAAWRALSDFSGSGMAQALRLLPGRLRPDANVALVAGIGKRTDADTVASNFAAACAETGRRVLLVDANLGGQRLNTLLGVKPGPGLGELLTGDANLEQALVSSPLPGVTLLSAGAQPKPGIVNPARFASLIEELGERFDLVVVDLIEPLQQQMASGMLNVTDALLLVVNKNDATEAVLRPYSAWAQQRAADWQPILVVYDGTGRGDNGAPTVPSTPALARPA
jgi:Mrp family chromosome partitioning ATPase